METTMRVAKRVAALSALLVVLAFSSANAKIAE